MSLPFASLFPSRPEFFQNFDFFDIANGVGYDVYFGLSNAGITATSTISSNYSGMPHKNPAAVVNVGIGSTFVELVDFDWDITFNLPKTIKGDILVQVPFGIITGGATTYTMKCTADIYHFDGVATETQIGSTATSEILQEAVGGATIKSHITTLKVNAATAVHFKRGETLRFSLKVLAWHANGGSAQNLLGGFGCNPQNSTDSKIELLVNDQTETQIITTNQPTQMAFHVPFVIPN